MQLHGTINHVALTVSNLDEAMRFFQPFFEFFGHTVSEPFAAGAYYAFYFLGPDGLKIEVVYMPELDRPAKP